MKRHEFLSTLVEELEIESNISEETALADIDEWDSLAAITTLAVFNKKLGLKIKAPDIKNCITVSDMLNLGNPKYDS